MSLSFHRKKIKLKPYNRQCIIFQGLALQPSTQQKFVSLGRLLQHAQVLCQPGLSRYCTVPSSGNNHMLQQCNNSSSTAMMETTTDARLSGRLSQIWLRAGDLKISYLIFTRLQLIANKDGAYFSIIFIA